MRLGIRIKRVWWRVFIRWGERGPLLGRFAFLLFAFRMPFFWGGREGGRDGGCARAGSGV